jgi:glycerol uptake facilitator protein
MTPTDILLGETFGTLALVLLGNGVVAGVLLAKSKARDAGWIAITSGWAFAVFVGIVIAGPVSHAHLNPAVTLGLAAEYLASGGTAGTSPAQVPFYLAGQFLGAFLGATLVALHYWPHWRPTEDPGAKLAAFATAPAIRSTPFNFLSELIGTFLLVFFILALDTNGAADGVTIAHGGTAALGALPVALLVFAIGLGLGGTTGYAINPARDLGPRIIHAILPIPGKGGSDWGYAWIPVAGPIAGGILAALTYQVVWVGVLAM